MARKYEYRPNCFALAMEPCEERLLIASFMDLEGKAFGETWPHDFRYHFFTNGAGVSVFLLKSMNAIRIRQNRPALPFAETDPTNYCLLNDKPLKAQKRQEWLHEYRQLSDPDKTRWFNEEWAATMALQPAIITYASRQEQAKVFDGRILSRRETMLRVEAKVRHDLAPWLDAKMRIIKQLQLASELPNAEPLIADIVGKVEPIAALEIAEQIEHPVIREALLRRSLEAA